jgi:predicted amidophosphoribosyltransferase
MNFNFLGDIFFPPMCVGCGDSIPHGVICTPCRSGIEQFDTLFCGTCNARLPERKKICHRDTPYLLGSAGPYDDDTLKALIHALKFQGIAGAAEPLAGILAEYADRLELPLGGFIATPVPLSEKRMRARGFNQSALIAKLFAVASGIAFDECLLVRVQHRKPQSDTQDHRPHRCKSLAGGRIIAGAHC